MEFQAIDCDKYIQEDSIHACITEIKHPKMNEIIEG